MQENPVWYRHQTIYGTLLAKNKFTTRFQEMKTEQVLTLEAAWQPSARTTEPVLFHPRLSNSLLCFSIKTFSFIRKSVTCNLKIRKWDAVGTPRITNTPRDDLPNALYLMTSQHQVQTSSSHWFIQYVTLHNKIQSIRIFYNAHDC